MATTPPRVLIVLLACLGFAVLMFTIGNTRLGAAQASINQLAAARTARTESRTITTSVLTVWDDAKSAARSKDDTGGPDAMDRASTERNRAWKSLEVFDAAGVDERQVNSVREDLDAFFNMAIQSFTKPSTTRSQDELERAAQRAISGASTLANSGEQVAKAAANSASQSLLLARIALVLTPVTLIGAGLYAEGALNKRNRLEVAAIAGRLEALGRGDDAGALDPREGPIHENLAEPFRLMTAGVASAIERLEVWGRVSDIGRAVRAAMEAVRSRGDIGRAVGESFNIIAPTLPMELMVLSPDASRLLRIGVNPGAGAPQCPVGSPDYCPAVRAASPMLFANASASDACPQLRARGLTGAACCLPVRNAGRRLGVIHVTAPSASDLDTNVMDALGTVADLAGAKLAQVQAFEDTWKRATTDQLTGLSNRRAFEDRANELIARQVPFILVMADLDHFKRLNDEFGHETGDQVLQSFARVLRENIRRSDTAARFGGEEFLALLPDVSMNEALVTLDRVRMAFAPTLGIAGLPRATASFGVTRSVVAERLEEIIRVADAGLYLAKKNGRDRVEQADLSTVAVVFGDGRALPPAGGDEGDTDGRAPRAITAGGRGQTRRQPSRGGTGRSGSHTARNRT